MRNRPGGFLCRTSWAAALGLALAFAPPAQARVEIHYAPQENLADIDVGLIDNAENAIDIAAYVLSSPEVIRALCDAADRGVAIRIYLDRSEFASHGPDRGGPIAELLAMPNVAARVKGRGVLMHLKAYAVDGVRLRTGSGNFSRPSLEAQDNDLVLIDDAEAVSAFEHNFETLWDRAVNLDAIAGATVATEP